MRDTGGHIDFGGIGLDRITVYCDATRLSELIAAGYTVDFENRAYEDKTPMMLLEVFDSGRNIGQCTFYDVPGDSTFEYLSRQPINDLYLYQPKPKPSLLKKLIKYAVIPFAAHMVAASFIFAACAIPSFSVFVGRALRAGSVFAFIFIVITLIMPAVVSGTLWSSAFPTYSKIKERLVSGGLTALNFAISLSYFVLISSAFR